MGPTRPASSAARLSDPAGGRPTVVVVDRQLPGPDQLVARILQETADPEWEALWPVGGRPDVMAARDVDATLRIVASGTVIAVIAVQPPGETRLEQRTRELRNALGDLPLLVICDGADGSRGELIGSGADDVLDQSGLEASLLRSLTAEVRRARRNTRDRLVSTHLLADALFRESGYCLLDGSGTIVSTALKSSEPWSGGLIGIRAVELVAGLDASRFEDARRLARRFPSTPRTVEVEVVSPVPGRRWVEITLVEIGQASVVDGIVATHRDVTDLHGGPSHAVPDADVIECLAEGVVVYLPDGTITVWNRSAAQLLGTSAEAALGGDVRSQLGHVPRLDDSRGTDSPHLWQDEVRIVLADGSEQVIERVFTQLWGDRGALRETVLVIRSVTERRAAEAVSQRFAAILDSSSEAIFSMTTPGIITTWNASAARTYGYGADEVIGRHVRMLVPEDHRAELESIIAKVADGAVVERLETVRRRKDMSEANVVLSVSPLFDEEMKVIGAITVARDVTEHRAAEEEREVAELRFDGAFRRSTFGMANADLLGRLTNVNPALCELLGRSAREIVGHQLSDFAHAESTPAEPARVPSVYDGIDSHTDERRYRRPDGVVIWLQTNVSLIRGVDDEPLYLTVQALDITSRKRMEYELEHRALHDDLTGLPNRALLNDRLEQALAVARRTGHQVGVAFFDVDGFKHVNDALGHGTGDALLVELGRRLVATVRPDDTVARIGGDEFVVLCPDVSVESMQMLAARIRTTVGERFHVGGHDIEVHASLGITVGVPESSAQSVLSEADAAMFRAKELGRNRVAVFDEALRARAADFLEGEKALRLAIARRELVAYYQPIIDLTAGRPIGVEALARWVREDGTVVPPDDFIPLAETTGLIVRLGELMLMEAINSVSEWNYGNGEQEQIWVSVNLSARQLAEETLVATVRDVLGGSGLRPDQLHLEITETVVMDDVEASIEKLDQIRALGVRLSVDDFGTGYSSLAYLKQLPIDTLKIDHSFVDGVVTEPDDRTIVEAVIGLGRALGLTCLAEGVETPQQLDALVRLGCELGQGYLWARPMPAEDARQWMAQRLNSG
jgi:diguanylate cyclase (GGDEF)-like protein/PAS domain S-box-containing protein